MAAECEKNQIPVVVFNKYTVNKNVMTVCSDNVRAGWMAANHFYDKGCRNFAFIGSHTFLSTSKDRLRGFTDALYEKGIENCISKMVPYTYKAGAAAVREILNEQKDIDAIFCAGDLLALGAMDAIKYEYGLKIPEDIAIIGFDNIEAASWPPYTLTTFEQQIDKMLDSAFNYLSKSLMAKLLMKVWSCLNVHLLKETLLNYFIFYSISTKYCKNMLTNVKISCKLYSLNLKRIHFIKIL